MIVEASVPPAAVARHARVVYLTLALCFLAAVLEGFGLQSVGVAARRMAAEFRLSAAMMGWIASASTIGLLPGAVIGGRLADRMGRRRVLAVAVAAFGTFSLLLGSAHSAAMLVALRLLAGLGFGATLPTLIALSAETAEPSSRGRYIGLMYCGVPAGGAVASWISIAGGAAADWRLIFYSGGLLALLTAPALWFALPGSRRDVSGISQERTPAGSASSAAQALFGSRRATTTLLLWGALFLHMLVIYVLLNWLPVLLVRKGFTPWQAGTIQILFNLGGVGGNVLFGWLMDRARRGPTALVMYACVIASLAALADTRGFAGMALVGLGVGLFAIGGQMVLYAMVPDYYPARMRGTGIGWAVAVGRVGSFAGPILAGQVLQAGASAHAILAAAAPALALAAAAVLAVLPRSQAGD